MEVEFPHKGHNVECMMDARVKGSGLDAALESDIRHCLLM